MGDKIFMARTKVPWGTTKKQKKRNEEHDTNSKENEQKDEGVKISTERMNAEKEDESCTN